MLACVSVAGQTRPPMRRPPVSSPSAQYAEGAVKAAIEILGNSKKNLDRDVLTLKHLRSADVALTDPMQPAVAIQAALEKVQAAEATVIDFYARQGIIAVRQALESARRSPGSADFGRLRAMLQDGAIGPSARVCARNAASLQEETMAWLTVQDLIGLHLRQMTEISSEHLNAAQ